MKKNLFENNSLTYREEKGRYTTILSECRFNEYLHEIDLEANQMLDSIISHFAAERGIDED